MEIKKQIVQIGKALLISMIVTVILLLLMAWVLYLTDLSGMIRHVMVVIIYLVACLLGGFVLGKRQEKRRFLWGAVCGVVYFLVLLLLSFWLPESLGETSQMTAQMAENSGGNYLRVFLICVLSGMAGGMLS